MSHKKIHEEIVESAHRVLIGQGYQRINSFEGPSGSTLHFYSCESTVIMQEWKKGFDGISFYKSIPWAELKGEG